MTCIVLNLVNLITVIDNIRHQNGLKFDVFYFD